MALKLYNIINKQWEIFQPHKKILIYCCGPTIYDDIHIGNGRPIIIFDALISFLKSIYPNHSIKYVRNITDIDQKIINKVIINGEQYENFIDKNLNNFNNLMDIIESNKPQQVRVTQCLDDIINYIQILINKNMAYQTPLGNIYFHTNK